MRSRVLTGRVLAWTLLLGLAAPVAAGGPPPDGGRKSTAGVAVAVPAAPRPAADAGLQEWPQRLADAERRVREAQRNARTAKSDYGRARSRKYPRGKERQALLDRIDATRVERDEAESEFSALVEAARRDGVPAGILTPFMDFDDDIQRLSAERG